MIAIMVIFTSQNPDLISQTPDIEVAQMRFQRAEGFQQNGMTVGINLIMSGIFSNMKVLDHQQMARRQEDGWEYVAPLA